MKYKLIFIFSIVLFSACSKSEDISPCNENSAVPCVEDANQEFQSNT
ncbi:hypothetical protein OAR04_03170 [Flavobacteriales bacterium]|nr:hypothetical protein [Flavobacteriales bacterium]